jgi:hypothetical protein
VLTESNKVYAFGNNNYGQLGLGIKDKIVNRPDIVSSLRSSGVCAIACGYSHSIALLKNEQLYSWGRNDCGQLGLGHYTHSPIPEHITSLNSFTVQQIECGYDHCIAFVNEIRAADLQKSKGGAILGRNRVFTWGRGEEGQLGHQDKLSRCVPKCVETLEARRRAYLPSMRHLRIRDIFECLQVRRDAGGARASGRPGAGLTV